MSVDRVVRQMTVDAVRPLEARRARLGFDALGEIEQQFQVEISGEANSGLGWAEIELTFDVEFMNATDERFSNLTVPHFTYGAVLSTPDPVLITAVVMSWESDARGIISGATVQVGALNPAGAVEYEGHVHLTFEGYGAPPEPDDLTSS